eukprot:9592071-Heterocapsa_arctica.AAC.1
MAGQSDAKTQQEPQPQGPPAPGAPPGVAPSWFLLVSHRFGRPCARKSLPCYGALPSEIP